MVRTLTRLADNHLTPVFLETMRKVVNIGGIYGIPAADGDEPRDQPEGATELVPERRRRRRPAPQGAQQGHQREIDMAYLTQRFDHMELRHNWFEGALSGYFASQGYHYPVPFPPPFGQQGDGAGPSGIHRQDEENDD